MIVAYPQCGFENLPGEKFCEESGLAASAFPSKPIPKELPFDEKMAKIQMYLPSGLIRRILSQKGKIEEGWRKITVMFADMQEFTPLVKKLGPEEVLE